MHYLQPPEVFLIDARTFSVQWPKHFKKNSSHSNIVFWSNCSSGHIKCSFEHPPIKFEQPQKADKEFLCLKKIQLAGKFFSRRSKNSGWESENDEKSILFWRKKKRFSPSKSSCGRVQGIVDKPAEKLW